MDYFICSTCAISKPKSEFNLRLGGDSEKTKKVCKKCEALRRRAKKHKLDVEQLIILQNQKCFTCGQPSDVIHDKLPFCRSCFNFINHCEKSKPDLAAWVEIYFRFKTEFPCFLHQHRLKLQNNEYSQKEFEFDA